MPRSRHSDPVFRYRHHKQDIIILCVRWYITYRLSYRDLAEMMAERNRCVYGVVVFAVRLCNAERRG